MNLHWYFVSELLCFVFTWFCMLFVVIRTSNLFLSITRSACVVSVSDWWLAHSWLHAVYSAENYGKRGLDSIRTDPRPWMRFRLDVTSLPELSWTSCFWIANILHLLPRDADVSSLPPLSWTPWFLYRLNTLHFLPRDALSFGRSPTLRGRDGHCV